MVRIRPGEPPLGINSLQDNRLVLVRILYRPRRVVRLNRLTVFGERVGHGFALRIHVVSLNVGQVGACFAQTADDRA